MLQSDLLSEVPDRNFSIPFSWLGMRGEFTSLSGFSNMVWRESELGMPGPFLTAVLAIFGPNTFFDTVASQGHYNNEGHLVCAQLRYPFNNTGIFESIDPLSESFLSSSLGDSQNSGLRCYSFDESINDLPPLLTAFLQWIPNFGSPHKTTAALTLATYAASNAMVEEAWHFEPSLSILTSPGVDLQKQTMPPAAMIVITLLLAVQVAGLAFLAYMRHLIQHGRSYWMPGRC